MPMIEMLFFFLVLSGTAFYRASANNATMMVRDGGVGLTTPDNNSHEPLSGWFAYMEKLEALRAQERLEDKARNAISDKTLKQLVEAVAIFDKTLQQLAEAVVTQDVSTRVDDCAPSTALIMGIKPADKNGSHCTAVPMLSPPPLSPYLAGSSSSSSSFFITAAHCFVSKGVLSVPPGMKVSVWFDFVTYDCALIGFPLPDLDLAMVYCAIPVPVPPTTLTSKPYRSRLSVAMLGHSLGEDIFSGNKMLYDGGLVVQHVRHTYLATSIQHPRAPTDLNHQPNSSSLEVITGHEVGGIHVASSTPPSRHQVASGFLVDSPEPGMSGGAVVDMHCGLLGITSAKSVWGVGGIFVRTTPYVAGELLAFVKHFTSDHQ